MQGLPSIVLLFLNKFNKFNTTGAYKFNTTGAQMVDSIYHMTLKLLLNLIFGVSSFVFIC